MYKLIVRLFTWNSFRYTPHFYALFTWNVRRERIIRKPLPCPFVCMFHLQNWWGHSY